MRRVLKLFVLTILFFGAGVIGAKATHLAGKEIFYRWTQDSTYEFTVLFYRNCQGSTAGPPMSMSISAKSVSTGQNNSFTVTRLPTFGPGIPPLEALNLYNCTDTNAFCIEEYYYRGQWTSPKRASDWVFSVSTCCRPTSGILFPQNVGTGQFWVECGLNNLDFPDYSSKNWSPVFNNRRPNHPGHLGDTISNPIFKTLCAGMFYALDQSAIEYQGDSMNYSFYVPQEINGDSMAYLNGNSFLYPLPLSGGPLFINPITGMIPLIPGAYAGSGNYMVGIQGEEYRNDTTWVGSTMVVQPKRIGYIRRELLIHINTPSTCRRDSVHIKNRTILNMTADSTLDVFFHNGVSGAPNSLVKCSSLSPDGSEFLVIDSSTYVAPNPSTIRVIPVLSASWKCDITGVTDRVRLKLAGPIACGNFSIILKTGTDLDVIESECGFLEPPGGSGELNTITNVSAYIGPDTTVCKNVPFTKTLSTNSGFTSYLWSNSDSNNTTVINDTGKVWVRVTNNFLCTATDTMVIHSSAPSPVNIGMDTLVCPRTNFAKTLNAGTGYAGYLWSTSETTSSIVVSSSGAKWVRVSNSLGCTDYDTVFIYASTIKPINLGPDTAFCEDDSISLTLVAGLGYEHIAWSTGDSIALINVSDSGQYWVIASDTNMCFESDTITIIRIDCDTLNNEVIGNMNDFSIRAYPNPVSHNLHVEIENIENGMSLRIKNLRGQVIAEKSLTNSVQVVDVSEYQPGLYLLELNDSGSVLFQSKVVVQR